MSEEFGAGEQQAAATDSRLVVFCLGGTTEGRELAQTDLPMRYSAATEYGADVISARHGLEVRYGALPPDELLQEFCAMDVACIVDATHPYATSISENAQTCAQQAKKPYLRLARTASAQVAGSDVHYVADEKAAAHLIATQFPTSCVFLSTGAHRLAAYAEAGFAARCVVRVLPFGPSYEKARAAGIAEDHIIQAQGPYSVEDNVQHFKASAADVLVTKDGGTTGGFLEKIEAARKLGMEIIVLSRPQEVAGEGATVSSVAEAYAWAKRQLADAQANAQANKAHNAR